MEILGFNWPLLIFQLINLLILICVPIFDIIALRHLSQRKLTDMLKVLWVVVILFVPVLGAIAFWMMRPGLLVVGLTQKKENRSL